MSLSAILRLAMYVPLCAASLALSPLRAHSSSEEPYRVLPPSGGLAPHPAVLLVPGCSGFAAHNGVNLYDERAAELQAAGYVVVFVDYIARRMQSNCAHVSPAEAGSEILEAAMWTKRQSGIDANRISVIAWSYGARGVLTALETMPPDTPIAKVVMYYPVCRGASAWSTPAVGLILLGAMDDIAYPALCEAVVKGMSPDKLRVITYPNARHGFDMRGLPERSDHLAGAPAYNPDAAKASWSEGTRILGDELGCKVRQACQEAQERTSGRRRTGLAGGAAHKPLRASHKFTGTTIGGFRGWPSWTRIDLCASCPSHRFGACLRKPP